MSDVREFEDREKVPSEVWPQSFEDKYEQFIEGAYVSMHSLEDPINAQTRDTLRLGINLLETYRHCFDELKFYRRKYTKIPPIDLEMSGILNCHIGKCGCGQLLREDRDKCCPKCSQFIAWPENE